MWDANTQAVTLSRRAGNQATLEHELGHNAYIRDAETGRRQRDAAGGAARNWVIPPGGDPWGDYDAYTLGPAEVDVRLAEIKRHYAHHTGRIVDSPGEAQRAWEWWRANQSLFQEHWRAGETEDQVERPGENPTLTPETFDLYDSQPAHMKEQMLHRMPELVESRRRPYGRG
jgi:hypothetical protein